jgi:hypothetical protein
VSAWVAWSSPLGRPLHQLGLELVMMTALVLTLRDAVGRYRRGQRWPLFQWLVILAYGVTMELIAFNFYDNYVHARFSVQLYHGKLPLYVPCCYIAFHYCGLMMVQRFGLGVVVEALLAGLAICAIDVPFDLAGPRAGWWVWSTRDPNLAVRWLGVPVTSYYWYLLFGAVLAALCRVTRRRIEPRPLALYALLAPLVAVAVFVLGVVAFLPFHALVAVGVPAAAIVAGHLTGCVALALARLRGRSGLALPALPWALRAVPLAVATYCIAVMGRGGVPDLVMGLAAALVTARLAWPLAPSGRSGEVVGPALADQAQRRG